MTPYILEERKDNAVTVDIYSRLLTDRIIFLGAEIDSEVANIVQTQLLYLEAQDNTSNITMYINSPGGIVQDGLAIYDTMQLIKPPVITVCTGMAASMAAIILAAGSTRYCLPHSKVMIHQPSGFTSGKTTDILIDAEEIKKDRETLASILAHHTNKSMEEILKDFEKDKWFTPEEALSYNLIDSILK